MEKLFSMEEGKKPTFRARKITTNAYGYSYLLIPKSALAHLGTSNIDIELVPDGVLLKPRIPT